ncbi:hypothetical protein [Streptomyces gardneri]|uniref:hypothetical protein n=1 Tax=Streptomyces gardneri TaxID=66892 RepID=UPI00340DA36F
MASTASADRPASRRVTLGLLAAGLVLPLVLSACSSGGGGSATGSRAVADRTVRMEGDLNRTYNVPSLAVFARHAGVVNVISGTVTATRPRVTQPANTVETILTIAVERQRKTGAPTTVSVREQGGIVTVSQVRSDFEGKLGRELTEEELAETVDYRFNGIEHARVGDRVLVVVADDTAVQKKDGAYVNLARLVGEGASEGLSGGSSTTFTWPGEPLNPAWESVVDVESLM